MEITKLNLVVRNKNIAFIRVTLMVVLFFIYCITSTVNAQCVGHWRDVAYDTKIMKRYIPYINCVRWMAYQFELPEELLYSVLYVERGSVTGKCMSNKNGTEDCGPAQINDVRIPELKKFDLDKQDIKFNPCKNIWVMGYLLRRDIETANGDIWKGVGNYHYHYSVNKKIHDKYVNRVRKAWKNLVKVVAKKCND